MDKQKAARIEVWHDTTSDPSTPVWCVSACTEDGDEIKCIDTADTRAEAVETGHREADDRALPLCERDSDGTLTTLREDPRPAMSRIATAIEDESRRQVIDRLGYTPTTWYTGGSEHNDYRLSASVDGGQIMVTYGSAREPYSGDGSDDNIESYVSDWLDMTMPEAE